MSCIKFVNKVNQEKKIFYSKKKYKNLKRDKFVELGDRGLIFFFYSASAHHLNSSFTIG